MNGEDQQQAYDDIYGDKNKDDKSGLDKAADAGKKVKKAGKLALNLGKLASTPLGWIILGIIGVILFVFLVVGAVSFLQTMPGLILEKIKEMEKVFATIVETAFTGNDVAALISEEDIVDLAQYVQDMGYDLYTNGFGKPIYEEDENGNKTTTIKTMDENYESPLYRYVFADLRTYTRRSTKTFLCNLYTAAGSGVLIGIGYGAASGAGVFSGPAAAVGAVGGALVGTASIISRAIQSDHWNGQGMLYIHDGLIENGTIDIDNKTLIMERYQGGLSFTNNKYAYSLDGWTGKYGIPTSFSLALHLSTMKPDLVTTIIETFDTTVHIGQYKTNISLKSSYKDSEGNEYSPEDALEQGLITEEQFDEISDIDNDDIPIYQPYIQKVEDHWFYNDIFFGEKGNWGVYEVSEDTHDKYYQYSDPDNILEGNNGSIWLAEHGTTPNIKQVRQPEVTKPNEKIKEIFADKYYTYDGTEKTADAIEEARKNGDDSLKKPVEFDKKDALEAFSILENCKDLDSQYIYRNLKELLIELQYFTEEDFATPDTLVLKWILSGYKPQKWPQRENENSYGAILYSKSTADKEEVGFEAEKSVTSPGKGIISKISEDSITIKFTEPEVVLDFSMKISGFKVNEDLKEGEKIEQGAEIGKTTDSDIRMILKDAKGSIIDHIEDYISPKKAAVDSDWAFLYFLPYESGGIDGAGHGPECVGVISDGIEAGVGIAQWTTKLYLDENGNITGTMNNIESFCKYAYETDRTLCAELQKFIGKDAIWILQNIDTVRNAFADVCNTPEDRDAFLNLQLDKFKETFGDYINAKNASWVFDRPAVVQGTIASLKNWGGSDNWTKNSDGITYSTEDDLEIIRDTLYRACFIPTGVGTLEGRWESQYVLAKDILEGVISEEELESWVRNKDIHRYEEKQNAGVLLH